MPADRAAASTAGISLNMDIVERVGVAGATLTFSETTHWIFRDGPSERTIRPSGRFSSSGVDGFLAACIAGLGLTRLSAWDAREEVLSGRLVRIDLEDAQPQALSVWAVYPTRRHVLPKLRVFLDMLQAELGRWNPPDEMGSER